MPAPSGTRPASAPSPPPADPAPRTPPPVPRPPEPPYPAPRTPTPVPRPPLMEPTYTWVPNGLHRLQPVQSNNNLCNADRYGAPRRHQVCTVRCGRPVRVPSNERHVAAVQRAPTRSGPTSATSLPEPTYTWVPCPLHRLQTAQSTSNLRIRGFLAAWHGLQAGQRASNLHIRAERHRHGDRDGRGLAGAMTVCAWEGRNWITEVGAAATRHARGKLGRCDRIPNPEPR